VRLSLGGRTRAAAGTPVHVEILAETRPGALVIPAAAIVEDEGEVFVMVAGRDDKAHKYPIAVGLVSRGLAEITTGLSAGDRVIVRGQDGLPEGAAVTVTP
jgi:multidrug efflux pump subunit AcrA (membrane-fusion protein)